LCGAVALACLGCGFKSPTAPTGVAGSSGGAGAGTTGAAGSTGAAGDVGPTGAAGTSSAAGSSGAAGSTPDASGVGGAGGTPTGGAGTDGTAGVAGGPKNSKLMFTKITIHTRFLAESVAIGDFDHDGTLDIAAGKRWYKGPFVPGYSPATAGNEHIYRTGHDDLPVTGIADEINTGVSDSWSAFGYDFDGDGWDDILQNSASDIGPVATGQTQPIPPGTGYWYQNPHNAAGNWPRYLISNDMKAEHKAYADMDGDGKPEMLGACKNCTPPETWGYWSADWKNPTAQWTFHSVTRMYPFKDNCCGWIHGLGAGDINGDGKLDLMERSGVWLQPATAGQPWQFINYAFSIPEFLGTAPDIGGSNMYAYDVDGDGLADIVSSSNSHGYGLAWHRQSPAGTFTRNMIMNVPGFPTATDTKDTTEFSQLHSLWLYDMDGDGLKDIVTGKTFLAHPFTTGDAGGSGSGGVGTEPTVLYIFKLVRTPTVHWVPYPIDVDSPTQKSSGVAREFRVVDMNKDGIPDIVISSKRGLFVFLGQAS
jgi:hypothetical protein